MCVEMYNEPKVLTFGNTLRSFPTFYVKKQSPKRNPRKCILADFHRGRQFPQVIVHFRETRKRVCICVTRVRRRSSSPKGEGFPARSKFEANLKFFSTVVARPSEICTFKYLMNQITNTLLNSQFQFQPVAFLSVFDL